MHIAYRRSDRETLLSEGWEVAHSESNATRPPAQWLSAVMPAMVQLQWHLAGQAPDPYAGAHSAAYEWMEERSWWLRRRITRAEAPEAGTSLRVVFDAIDHDAVVYLDGQEVATHRGAFGGPIVTLPDGDEHELIVRIEPRGTGRGHEYQLSTSFGPTAARLESLVKSEVMCRWIPNPHFMTAGIWRMPRLVATNEWSIERPFVRTTQLDPGSATIDVSFEILYRDVTATSEFFLRAHTMPRLHPDHGVDVPRPGPAEVVIVIRDPDGRAVVERTVAVERAFGREWYETTVEVPEPRLWTVHSEGDQWQYSVELSLNDRGAESDRIEVAFGIRTFELRRTRTSRLSDRPADFMPVLNGEEHRLFGVNWEPIDLFAADEARYRWFLERARDAGVELIRVWGGGLLEDNVFYDLCDELGILVWQDFPVNCFVNADRADLALWEEQAIENVHRLRNHPSLAVWCGGNEFDPYNAANSGLSGVLERTVSDFDGTRPWVRACPDGGDIHVYLDSDTTWYLPLYGGAAAITEWGSHAMPHVHTIAEFVSPAEAAAPLGSEELADGEAFARTHPDMLSHWAEFNPMRVPRMLQRAKIFGEVSGTTLDDFVESVNHGAAEVYETTARDMRAWAPDLGIMLLWVYNRPWPSVGMQLVDHSGRPNAGYYAVRRAYGPRYATVTVDHEVVAPGEQITARIASDPLSSAEGTDIRVRVFDSSLELAQQSIVPHGSAVDVRVPDGERAGVFVVADLQDGEGAHTHRSLRWLRVSSSLEETATRDAYRAEPQESIVDDTTPARSAVSDRETSLSVQIDSVERGRGEETLARVIVTNDGAHPAVATRVDVADAGWLLAAEDNFFWLDAGESRHLLLTLRPSASIRARHMEAPAASSPIVLEIRGWNADVRRIELDPSTKEMTR